MAEPYDPQNIFARILRGEIPNKTVLETAHTLAFHDITPQAPTHILVIPKGPYTTLDHFAAAATAEEILDFHQALARICAPLPRGYRAISNAGADGMQEVPHYHVHILAGKALGPLVPR